MLNEKFLEVCKHEGVTTIVTWTGQETPYVCNTWNTYLEITTDDKILVPAHGLKKAEEDLKKNPQIILAAGTREVKGFNDYPGTGFLVHGTATFVYEGAYFDYMKEKYPWITRIIEITPETITQRI